MAVAEKDRTLVRELARQVAEIAHLPVQDRKREMWTRLNRLDKVRPMVWINELPWYELEGDLPRQCTDDFCARVERQLRTTLYLWEHLRCDMVVDPVFYSPYAIRDTGFGMAEDSLRPDDAHGARQYLPTINALADAEKIEMPQVSVDWDATERSYERLAELVGDALTVEKRGICHIWCAPWDVLICWWGITKLYTDMLDNPGLVHAGIGRMMDALLHRLDQYERLGLLSVSNGNHRVGSGGLGITDQLPQPDVDGVHARPMDIWGTSTGQIFSEVSPAMHEEFCLAYERRWLERFGLNCYGCCEPLHNKVHLMRTIPRLRRISMSTWIDIDKAAEAIGTDYIFSYKPNPAVLAAETWNPEAARADLRNCLEKTRGCHVELIMKDVSTCRNEPRRVWEWCALAVEMAEQYA